MMKNMNKQNGIALVIVLWMLVLLTIMATGYSRMMRTETMLTANLVRSAQANALAEAGINQAIIELYKPVLDKIWKDDGTKYDYQLNDAIVNVHIQSETGKIDLNSARSELLMGLLQSVDVPNEDQLPLVQAILDWRDKDDLVRNNGAEDAYYKNAGLNYGAKDGSFNSIDELLLVKGFTATLYRKLRPALTVYSHQAGIDPQSAPREALLAIPNITESEVDYYIAQRDASDEPGQLIPTLGVDSEYLAKGRGTVFLVTSEAKINNTLARVNAVISLRRNGQQPYSILAWQIAPKVTASKQEVMEDGEINHEELENS